jgi:hypothetical protein
VAGGHTFAGMRTIRFLTAVATLLALAGCGGGQSKAAETTTTTTVVATTTTAAATTTTAAATTTAATTTTTAQTTSSAAPEPTAAIQQAILDYESVRYACLRLPATCDPLTYARGKRVDSERELIDRIVGLHAHARRQEDDVSYWRLRSIEVSADRTSAKVKGCYWSTDIIEIDSGAIFNDEKVSYEQTIDLAIEDGRWWISHIFTDQRTPGANTCGERR